MIARSFFFHWNRLERLREPHRPNHPVASCRSPTLLFFFCYQIWKLQICCEDHQTEQLRRVPALFDFFLRLKAKTPGLLNHHIMKIGKRLKIPFPRDYQSNKSKPFSVQPHLSFWLEKVKRLWPIENTGHGRVAQQWAVKKPQNIAIYSAWKAYKGKHWEELKKTVFRPLPLRKSDNDLNIFSCGKNFR